MESLVYWKKRRDKFQDSDINGPGDQVDDFDEQGYVKLTGSHDKVKFIMKDETNASSMKKLGIKW